MSYSLTVYIQLCTEREPVKTEYLESPFKLFIAIQVCRQPVMKIPANTKPYIIKLAILLNQLFILTVINLSIQ